MGSSCLTEAPSSSQCHSRERGTGGERVGEKAAKWHSQVVDTSESTQESNGAMSRMGEKLSLPDLPWQTPESPLPAGVSQQVLTKVFPPGTALNCL